MNFVISKVRYYFVLFVWVFLWWWWCTQGRSRGVGGSLPAPASSLLVL